MQSSKLGFGIVGALDLETVRAIAARAEELGIHSLWINDTPGGDSLAGLEVAAQATSRILLATGVISVDRKPAAQIIKEIDERGIPRERLIVGIGSSAKPSPLRLVSDNLEILNERPGATVVVGALGPKMRQLGAEQSNGLLFNWLTPEYARVTTQEMRNQAQAASNMDVVAATYIRTAFGDDAMPRLEAEAANYSSIPSYAANFARLGITALETSVHSDTADGIVAGIAAFDGTVDHAIVRAITPNDDVDHYLRLLDVIAPLA
jgi:alkanesulfonate monooxygenase SsuD/methylene tetrahydromethanopterin reductase-like flavin-dependent oxidoreductase (luciferase family)